MLRSVDLSGRPFHFIGIGGIGMSALAHILSRRGLPVSGSDLRLSHITHRLQENGAHIFWSQDPSNLDFFKPQTEVAKTPVAVATLPTGCTDASEGVAIATPPATAANFLPQVICSTAIHPDNAEYRAACELGCPIFHRSDLLAALMKDYRGIAVAGTHGKTTTSSMVGHVLLKSGIDPTIIVGGEVNTWGGNAHLGQGPHLVAEADESDGSLVKLWAEIGIITNIELDHPDHYQDLDQVVDIFTTFADHCKTVVGCIDCATVRDRIQPSITYSLDPESGADYTVDCVSHRAEGTLARVWEKGQVLGQLNLKLLGAHNLSNALAAIAVGRLVGLEFAEIAGAIATFEGARRRFEHRGEHHNILFVDDYAHHPSEIRATLAAARLQVAASNQSRQGRRRVVAVFQPHRYSRTAAFLDEFATAFGDADQVVLTDIYAAGEPNPGNLSGQTVASRVAAHHDHVLYQPTAQAVVDCLKQVLKPGDMALFLGAGNLNQVIPDIMLYYEQAEQALAQELCS